MQSTSIEKLARRAFAVHRPQKRERLRIGPEQDVLAVVERALAKVDAPRTPAEQARSLEHADNAPGAGKGHRGRHARPAATDDGDGYAHCESAMALNTAKRFSTRSRP